MAFIVNPQAANKKWERRRSIHNKLLKNFNDRIINTPQSKQQTIEVTKTISQDHDILVAVGGDGTIADVIQGVVEARKEKDVVLGILPLGSGNAFRKSLHIPKSLRKAMRVLSEAHTREIDLLLIEGKAAGFASIGATAKVTQDKLEHKIPGFFGHLLAGRAVLSLPKREVMVELLDGFDDRGERFEKKSFKVDLFDCVIGKTNYFGYSWRIAPKARIDDSYLDITFFETSGIKYLLFFPLIYFGLYQKSQKHFKARKMILRGKNLPIQYNGEFLDVRDCVQTEVLPRAIRVIAPKRTAEKRKHLFFCGR